MGRKVQMQQRTFLLSAFTLSASMAFGFAAAAADLPKEGTFNVDYTAFGTVKGTAIGKERIMFTSDENGLYLGKGFGDHVTLHNFGLGDIANGMEQFRGYGVGTDPNGDQIVFDYVSDGKFPADAKSYSGNITFTTGTGKYAGISGGGPFTCHSPEFRTAAEGTYAQSCTQSGSYKLP
jgi:hypothetical protein